MTHHVDHTFTFKIIIGMIAGIIIGLLVRWLPLSASVQNFLIDNIFRVGGDIFLNIIRMLVVPIVLVSLICGGSTLGDLKRFGRVGGKTVFLYLLTTVVAITLAILFADLLHIGHGLNLKTTDQMVAQKPPGIRNIIISMFPSNPFKAMSQGIMLQVIIFALLFGAAVSATAEKATKLINIFQEINEVLMKLITMIMRTAPYGVFCLLAALFARMGFTVISDLASYFFLVLAILFIQMLVTYSVFLKLFGRLSPIMFFKKMRDAMLFAFSISSSNASIPVVLKTVEKRLGVDNGIASFIIPLGSTINMDGTAVMQGVATVFIAHAYNIPLGITGYLIVILMATLASIGTAGVPSVGLITLAMVLEQVGLPVQGVALIIGVDRLLDMVRTAVNISGDSMIACLVAKSEKVLDQNVFDKPIEVKEV